MQLAVAVGVAETALVEVAVGVAVVVDVAVAVCVEVAVGVEVAVAVGVEPAMQPPVITSVSIHQPGADVASSVPILNLRMMVWPTMFGPRLTTVLI